MIEAEREETAFSRGSWQVASCSSPHETIAPQCDLWDVIHPSSRDRGWNDHAGSIGSRNVRGAVRSRRKTTAAATAAAVCLCCALWTWHFRDTSGSGSAASSSALAVVDLKTGSNTNVLVHIARKRDSRLVESLTGDLYGSRLYSKKLAGTGTLDGEYNEILGRITHARLGSSLLDSGSLKLDEPVHASQLATQGLVESPQDGVLESARSAVLTLKHQLADSSDKTAPTVRLNDAKLSVEKLRSELKTVRRSETASQQGSVSDVIQVVANAITGQYKPGQSTTRQPPEGDVHDAIANLFNDQHHREENATVPSNLTAEEQQIKSLASSVRRINSGMASSHVNTTAAHDAVGVLKRQAGTSQHPPVQAIVIRVQSSHSGSESAASQNGPSAQRQGSESAKAAAGNGLSRPLKTEQAISVPSSQQGPESANTAAGNGHSAQRQGFKSAKTAAGSGPAGQVHVPSGQQGPESANTADVNGGPSARLKPEHASKLRKVQLSHISTGGDGKGDDDPLGWNSKPDDQSSKSDDQSSKSDDQSSKSDGCGCCGAAVHCSCCEKGWLGLQTFGKWLLMVLALVLCVMTFLIFGFMCFGCLWAWREFRRQDRWERFLDRTAGKGNKEEAEKPPSAAQKASGAASSPAQPSSGAAPGNGSAAGSTSGRPISRRADSQLAR
eukprot:973341-Rhodomonas_salina.1